VAITYGAGVAGCLLRLPVASGLCPMVWIFHVAITRQSGRSRSGPAFLSSP